MHTQGSADKDPLMECDQIRFIFQYRLLPLQSTQFSVNVAVLGSHW